jgi:uncharacterized membrane protein YczE
MQTQKYYRGIFYIIGLLVLALGIILNTKAGLGVSPIISVSYSISTILGLNFGNMTLVLYSLFVIIEMILHTLNYHKNKEGTLKVILLKDALQFPLSLVFTRFMNLFSAMIPAYDSPNAGAFYGSFVGRIIVLLVAIVLTGIGAAISLNMRLIPNPGDGIVQAIADTLGAGVGLTKNGFDLLNITITITVSLLFTGHLIGIGLGTVFAVIGVGRVIAVFNHFVKEKMDELAGLSYWNKKVIES